MASITCIDELRVKFNELGDDIDNDDAVLKVVMAEAKVLGVALEAKKEKQLHIGRAISNLVAFVEIEEAASSALHPADPWGDVE
jgi:hypothetical protein